MLSVEGVHAGYGPVPVLEGVSLAVAAGRFVAVVGPNGAGKTTLFKTISGIVRPSAGRITFDGTDLAGLPPSRRAHLGIAHVPEGRQVFPSMTVMENLEMGAYTDAGRAAWTENLERIMTWFPVLGERPGQAAGTLSGVVNVNTASAAELQLLPGVGEARARAIVAERKSRGGFRRVDDLVEVKGIGDSLLERLRPFLTLSGQTTAPVSYTHLTLPTIYSV